MPTPQAAIAQRRDDLERFEFMMGAERGRLAVTLDMLTDALILIGQHGIYCVSSRNPAKPALDLEAVLSEIGGAKELIQSVMEQLRLKREGLAEPEPPQTPEADAPVVSCNLRARSSAG